MPKIVVGYDGSEAADRALSRAAEYVAEAGVPEEMLLEVADDRDADLIGSAPASTASSSGCWRGRSTRRSRDGLT